MYYLPSVTEVISPWVSFPGVREDVLKAAADRGTLVHSLCADYAKGNYIIPPEEVAGYFNSFRQWFDLVVDSVILVEERLIDNDFWFCGQIDLLVKSKQKEVLLIDLKTPLALSKTWAIQIASYRQICKANKYFPHKSGSLRLSPDGKPPKMDWIENPDQAFVIFLSALNVFRYLNKKEA